ncbi:Re/Si-specific NAD(P)(+) transhydrogenase subunit alpha [Bdellovibrionota bacterium FG-1]
MKIGIPKEMRAGETRVAATPDSIKKLIKKGLEVCVQKTAGLGAGFRDEDYVAVGAQVADADVIFGADIVAKFHKPTGDEIKMMKKGGLLVSFIEPFSQEGTIENLAAAGVDCLGMELIPRTSRAQSMDALSSQGNIAGYRAVIEAAARYGRFMPLMMTSAGSAKQARVIVLGAGVAGLQAIATARRLGALVEAYDVRAEVKEQILSLGAKFIELDVGEEGSGTGGYAKELSEEGKRKQQQLLLEKLKKADIIITTANVPGRRAPTLVSEEAVKGMRMGSVIIDMAAPSGGNCPLTEADRVVVKHGVTIVGWTNYPGMVAADSSSFYAGNLGHLLGIMVDTKDGKTSLKLDLQDDIIAAALVTHNGTVRLAKR